MPASCQHPKNRIHYWVANDVKETKKGLKPKRVLCGGCCDCGEVVHEKEVSLVKEAA